MSVAFVREESAEAAQEVSLPPRAISAHPNLVTQSCLRGFERALADSQQALKSTRPVPDTFHMNDIVSFPFEGYNPAAYERALKDEFDQLYEEGATKRRMMVMALHDRISGHCQSGSGDRLFLRLCEDQVRCLVRSEGRDRGLGDEDPRQDPLSRSRSGSEDRSFGSVRLTRSAARPSAKVPPFSARRAVHSNQPPWPVILPAVSYVPGCATSISVAGRRWRVPTGGQQVTIATALDERLAIRVSTPVHAVRR
jgi:hypothetical protein